IVRCLGMQTVNGKEGLVLEMVKGKNSEAIFQEMRALIDTGELSDEEYWGVVQFTVARTLGAIAHMEKQGVAHNDIRPANIMLEAATGEVKLIDFGIASTLDQQFADNLQTPIGFGTVAPELVTDRTPTSGSDVFSAGSMAYHMGERDKFTYVDPDKYGGDNAA